jgi:hypothetical protein
MSTAPSPIANFGRAWYISLVPQNGGQRLALASIPASPSVHVEFSIERFMLQTVGQAKVVIYNLGNSTTSMISSGQNAQTAAAAAGKSLSLQDSILMGDTVTISAGYQSGPKASFNSAANLLFTGNVLQSIATRENVTDAKLTLVCVQNLAAQMFAKTNQPFPKGVSDWTIFQQAMKDAGLDQNQNIDSASQQALEATIYSKAHPVSGNSLDLIDDIAKQHNLAYWIGSGGFNMKSFDKAPTVADYAYGPPNLSSYKTQPVSTPGNIVKPTLIGVPEGTQDGVVFRVLLDSQVKIGNAVQIAPGTAINAYQFNYGTLQPIPNAQGIYRVAGIRHVGDSRGPGDDWYTEIIGMTPKFFSTRSLIGTPSAPANSN